MRWLLCKPELPLRRAIMHAKYTGVCCSEAALAAAAMSMVPLSAAPNSATRCKLLLLTLFLPQCVNHALPADAACVRCCHHTPGLEHTLSLVTDTRQCTYRQRADKRLHTIQHDSSRSGGC